MKKILLIIAVTLCGMMELKAQNCYEICLSYFRGDTVAYNACPQAKLDEICDQNRHFFFVTDEVGEGALVFDISEISSTITGLHPNINMVIDLNTFSYYAWNFYDFQKQDFYHTIYFRTPGSSHRYLAVRDINDAYLRGQMPEKYADENENK